MARERKPKVDKTPGRSMFVLWCENVRREAGNKMSYMGCFGSVMVLPKIPATLSELVAQVWIRSPLDKPLTEFKLSLISGENEVFSHQVEGKEPPASVLEAEEAAAATVQQYQLGVAFRDFVVDQPHRLYFQVSSKDGVFKSSSLSIREANPEENRALIASQLITPE